ncbi:FAS1 domain-containing protein [Flammula alnicola]|nr:FAS1 domain-containing protein [Flammula alnicola]
MLFTALPLSLLLPLLLSPVQAQDQNSTSSNSSAYVTDFISALESAGYSEVASTLPKINGTTVGNQLFSQLSSGRNFTLFVPDNTAVQNVSSKITSNPTLLAEHISYHFIRGDFTNTSYINTSSGGVGGGPLSTPTSSSTQTGSITPNATILFDRLFGVGRRDGSGSSNSSSDSNPQPYSGIWPNVTLGRTLFNAPQFVILPGNKNQVLAWTRSGENGNVTILNQAQNITVVNGTTWRNLFIVGINGTLIPPGNLTTALTAVNASAARTLLSGIDLPASNGASAPAIKVLQAARGITLFLPDNEAVTSAINGPLQRWQNNQAAQAALLQNHFINGTTLYSTEIDNSTVATSAAGEPFTFTRNDTGLFVSGANNFTAQIVRPDVLLQNGVAHIIDSVFFAVQSDPAAASSAYASATSEAAAISTTETGPIGGIIGQTSSQTPGQSSSASESSSPSSGSSASTASQTSPSVSSTVTGTAAPGQTSPSTLSTVTVTATPGQTSPTPSTLSTVTVTGSAAVLQQLASRGGPSYGLSWLYSMFFSILAGACILAV